MLYILLVACALAARPEFRKHTINDDNGDDDGKLDHIQCAASERATSHERNDSVMCGKWPRKQMLKDEFIDLMNTCTKVVIMPFDVLHKTRSRDAFIFPCAHVTYLVYTFIYGVLIRT